MSLAYLTNIYPAPSHSFIRREIEGLESLGLRVSRVAVRRHVSGLPDDRDQAEAERTAVLLGAGAMGLLAAAAQVFLTRPGKSLSAARCAVRLSRRGDRGLLIHLAYLAEACLLARWARRDGVEHVHAHFGTNSATVAMLCHRLGGPSFSMTVHGPEEFDRAAGIGLSEKIASARFVVAISEFTRSQLFRHCPTSMWDKIHIVHCGLDRQFLEASATPMPDAPTLVCVGRICEQKGQMLLLRAIAEVRKSVPSLRLTLAGDGPMRDELEAEIERLGLTDAVRITGYIDGQRVREEILAARAMVLPSFAEGLPVVLMEAMGLGRPVVSTYVAGIPELVEHGRNGWLVPAGSVDRLVDALREVLAAPVAQLARMGQEGRRVVLERHDAAKEAAKLAELFKGCGSPANAAKREPAGQGISAAPLRPVGQEL